MKNFFIFISIFLIAFCPSLQAAETLTDSKVMVNAIFTPSVPIVEVKKPKTDQDIRNDLETYILSHLEDNNFSIHDTKTNLARNLRFIRVHNKVNKLTDSYYLCVDFRDTATDELVDLDIQFAYQEGTLTVLEMLIHKINGLRRYNDFKYMRNPVLNKILSPHS